VWSRSLLRKTLQVQAWEWMKMSGSTSPNRTQSRHVTVAKAFHLRRSSSGCPSMDLAHRLAMRLDEAAKASRHERAVCCVESRQVRSVACELQSKICDRVALPTRE